MQVAENGYIRLIIPVLVKNIYIVVCNCVYKQCNIVAEIINISKLMLARYSEFHTLLQSSAGNSH